MLRVTRLTLCVGFICFASAVFAQVESATITGTVTDSSGALMSGADVEITSLEHGTTRHTVTNSVGIYLFPAVRPGRYNMEVRHDGFRQIDALGLTVNLQDHVEENFQMQVGSTVESVTVSAEGSPLNTQDATVSTIVDRNFAENLPMNGRSFQSLIELTPGVVAIQSGPQDGGQFSVNGQRGSSNYWTVDGVSANIGIGVNTNGQAGQGFGGVLGGVTAQGGTNGLVSIDALQEFRIDTSSFAPEYGRTPGGQITILTRSGTNEFHGELFDYLRNDALAANDWFADRNHLPKPEDRQNDFGGTFSGPILKDRTFFFFSYEGLRLRVPQVSDTTVPDLNARQTAASPAIESILNAYPRPTPSLPDNVSTGVAGFNASYSNPSTLDAASLRIDHRVNSKITLFGRYNYSPSEVDSRSPFATFGEFPLSVVERTKVAIQTTTGGISWLVSPDTETDVRFNFSRDATSARFTMDNFGGATPISGFPEPGGFTAQNSSVQFDILGLFGQSLDLGPVAENVQKQFNLVDTWSLQRRTHSLKFGVDYRRLTPSYGAPGYTQIALFSTVSNAATGNAALGFAESSLHSTLLLNSVSLFAQDSWRATPRLSLTYGVRWDPDFVPSAIVGPDFPAVNNFSLAAPSGIRLAPLGTPPYNSRFANVSPRLGVAYQIHRDPAWATVVRTGFGMFYDSTFAEIGNLLNAELYPFGGFRTAFGASYPFSTAVAAPPPIVLPGTGTGFQDAFTIDPNLKSPYTLQWNAAIEQEIAENQSLSATYVGARGKQLVSSIEFNSFAQFPGSLQLISNGGSSDYDALQLQFQRKLTKGLQVLSSYSWAHSIDTASTSSFEFNSNIPGGAQQTRGPSNWDIRNAFAAGATYNLPTPSTKAYVTRLIEDWSLQSIVQARSALPVDVVDQALVVLESSMADTQIRPDLVPGQPLYLYGSQYPGGKAFNPAAFAPPPIDPNTGEAIRQGDLSRNALRGFGALQWDFAAHRVFPITEKIKLEFRAELFNILNHPNFAPPLNDISQPTFGISNQMLGGYLDGNPGGGSFSSAYQIGEPRSIQFALKLTF